MKDSLGLSNKDFGDFSAGFSMGYGIFKLIGGVMTDFVCAHFLFSCGLLAASLLNFAFPFVASLLLDETNSANPDRDAYLIGLIWTFWSLNGILQGVGGPALSKVVIQSVDPQKRSLIWSNLHSVSKSL